MSRQDEVLRGVTGRDLAALGLVLAVCSPWIAAAALGKWDELQAWCVDRGVFVAGDEDPVLAFPRSDGAGLDGARVLIAAVAVVALVAVVWYARRRWRAYRRNRVQLSR